MLVNHALWGMIVQVLDRQQAVLREIIALLSEFFNLQLLLKRLVQVDIILRILALCILLIAFHVLQVIIAQKVHHRH